MVIANRQVPHLERTVELLCLTDGNLRRFRDDGFDLEGQPNQQRQQLIRQAKKRKADPCGAGEWPVYALARRAEDGSWQPAPLDPIRPGDKLGADLQVYSDQHARRMDVWCRQRREGEAKSVERAKSDKDFREFQQLVKEKGVAAVSAAAAPGVDVEAIRASLREEMRAELRGEMQAMVTEAIAAQAPGKPSEPSEPAVEETSEPPVEEMTRSGRRR